MAWEQDHWIDVCPLEVWGHVFAFSDALEQASLRSTSRWFTTAFAIAVRNGRFVPLAGSRSPHGMSNAFGADGIIENWFPIPLRPYHCCPFLVVWNKLTPSVHHVALGDDPDRDVPPSIRFAPIVALAMSLGSIADRLLHNGMLGRSSLLQVNASDASTWLHKSLATTVVTVVVFDSYPGVVGPSTPWKASLCRNLPLVSFIELVGFANVRRQADLLASNAFENCLNLTRLILPEHLQEPDVDLWKLTAGSWTRVTDSQSDDE